MLGIRKMSVVVGGVWSHTEAPPSKASGQGLCLRLGSGRGGSCRGEKFGWQAPREGQTHWGRCDHRQQQCRQGPYNATASNAVHKAQGLGLGTKASPSQKLEQKPQAQPCPVTECGCGAVSAWGPTTCSVAVLTAWVARNPIHPAAAAPADVSWAPGAPAWALGDPADLGVADGAADPVAAVLLLYHDLALGAAHGLALLQHHLQHLCRLPGRHIILSPQGQVLLVLLAVHLLVDGLAEQAVDMETHRAGELVDIILKETPSLAIWGLAMVAEGTAVFSNGDAQV